MLAGTSAHGFVVDHNNTIPGTVANKLIANGNGADWITAAVLMNLSTGSVYNDPSFDADVPQQNFWSTFPDLEFDSWVGVPGDSTTSILGAAVDLGDDPGDAVIADQKVSAAWFNTDPTNTGPTRIANITLTNDAMGTFSLRASFTGNPVQVLFEDGYVVNGRAYFSIPGDLDDDGYVGLDDLDIILNNWNQNVPPADPRADPSNDDYVGLDDLDILLNNWNFGIPPAAVSANVPEPAGLTLLALGGVTMLLRRR